MGFVVRYGTLPSCSSEAAPKLEIRQYHGPVPQDPVKLTALLTSMLMDPDVVEIHITMMHD